MKKSIIALSTILFLAVGVSNAQTSEATANEAQATQAVKPDEQVEAVQAESEVVEVVEQESKKEIKQDDLLAKVQEVLKSDRFNTWDVSKVYETSKDEKKVYEVVLMNGEKKATFKFDEDGKTIG